MFYIEREQAFSNGGGSGIRTHGTLADTTVFKTVSLDHSDTPPDSRLVEKWLSGNYTVKQLIRIDIA